MKRSQSIRLKLDERENNVPQTVAYFYFFGAYEMKGDESRTNGVLVRSIVSVDLKAVQVSARPVVSRKQLKVALTTRDDFGH